MARAAIGRKDLAVTMFTALVVLAFLTTPPGLGSAVVGDSHRWGFETMVRAVLGTVALAFALLALVTGPLTALSLLAVADVALWAVATLGHLGHEPRTTQPVYGRLRDECTAFPLHAQRRTKAAAASRKATTARSVVSAAGSAKPPMTRVPSMVRVKVYEGER